MKPMLHEPSHVGFKNLPEDLSGRVELTDPAEIAHFTLRPSQEAVSEVERLEESALIAEQRLGMILVG